LISTTWEQWAQWAAERAYNRLPYVRKYSLEAGEDRVAVWRGAWEQADEHAFVLESGKGGRYTYLGLRPSETIRGKDGFVAVQAGREPASEAERTGAPLQALREWMGRHRAPRPAGVPQFIGGCVGYLSYDVARSLERLPETAADDLMLPDFLFMRIDELWIIDHREPALFCAVHVPLPEGEGEARARAAYERAAARADEMKRLWDRITAAAKEAASRRETDARKEAIASGSLQIDVEAIPGLATSFNKEAFMEAVRRIQRYIGQGDVFQVNLSLRQSRPIRSRPEELYEWLRLFNPSPYMGLLKFPDFCLVSASPELLIRLEGDRISARPIAGTRRRGRTDEEDQNLEQELKASEKERAEHIMLVDLLRNDIGRTAAYGSVHVPELLTVERYSHVMHLVSQVEGRLAAGKDAFDVLAGVFPGGTITGAPKIRTMEIIEELEPVRRGPYTGSFGWIDYAGNMEFNIIIRTMVVKDGICHIQAGAGIVIDSDPEREFYECLNKAKALWKAVQYGEGAWDRADPEAASGELV
jgi:para-aminobenzoate synthetase component 1